MADAMVIKLISFAQFASPFQLNTKYAEIDICCEMGAHKHGVKWEWKIWAQASIYTVFPSY